jgi:hypothetical protein
MDTDMDTHLNPATETNAAEEKSTHQASDEKTTQGKVGVRLEYYHADSTSTKDIPVVTCRHPSV